eukprot:CFRG2099T1
MPPNAQPVSDCLLPFETLTRDKVPNEVNPELQKLIAPHVESFNFMLNAGLDLAVADLDKVEIVDDTGRVLRFWISECELGYPRLPERAQTTDHILYPSECRERGVSYKGPMMIQLNFELDGEIIYSDRRSLGQIPIMVKSEKCNIAGKTPRQLVRAHEEPEELGGYFIINGLEKIIRLLILPRRNYLTGIRRGAYKNRGPLYTTWGVQIRGVRDDQSAVTNVVHYLTNGSCTFKFNHRKQEFLVPCVVLMKALINTTDREIYNCINPGGQDAFIGDRVEAMLRDTVDRGLFTQEQCLMHIGKLFRHALALPARFTDKDCGTYLLERLVFVHLENPRDKFNLMVAAIQKLYRLVSGECKVDNPDAPSMQEVMLPGHLYNMFIKEKLNDWTVALKTVIEQHIRRGGDYNFSDPSFLGKMISKNPIDVGRKVEYFMATGNLVSATGLDLQQASGFTIQADKLNFYRYLSHFRCIHRGAFFSEMKTTAVRKLLPEAWGFLCPVHTPDGAPCGLLNHLSHTCEVVNEIHDTGCLPELLVSLGCVPIDTGVIYPPAYLSVFLDGRVVAKVVPQLAQKVADRIRYMKVMGEEYVPRSLEITVIQESKGGLFPGLFLFASAARFVRPVQYLSTGQNEMVGSFEQVFLNIACLPEDVHQGQTTHMEHHPTHVLSVVANMTPFSDHNQSPRNMYQCQMGKQTMGTPMSAYPYRCDNKLYRIRTPQAPIVRNALYNHYKLDNYPLGQNAVVCVISYTGYDMEDAMILNKGSEDRGFAHGTVYKNKVVDLKKERRANESISHRFGISERDLIKYENKIDTDGFAPLGTLLKAGDPLYSMVDVFTGISKVIAYKESEEAYVEEIRVVGNDSGTEEAQKAIIKLRVVRNPIIGDKFSSRHGQKGVCSKKYGMEDMPFTESGMQPDIIINPHAFPSRMTIGMLVESMAGKAGASHGLCYDSTPFQFNEKNTAYDFFGDQLTKAGYNYHGSERMYSGISGVELEVDIFIGVVYYQRLRHMVSDKFQVRTTGPVDPKTHQPVKGRKRHGGIRLGEMERDSLLAHGTSFLLQDRLMNCSDISYCHLCKLCGSILSPMVDHGDKSIKHKTVTCRVCETGRGVETVSVPYVFRYLVSEMYAMNMRLTLDVE